MNAIPPSFTWTDEKVEALKQGVLDGASFSRIADDIGATRNACIGKARRLGVSPGRKQPDPYRRPHRRKPMWGQLDRDPIAMPRAPEISKTKAVRRIGGKPMNRVAQVISGPQESRPVTLMDLTDEACHWPLFDDPKFPVESNFYCGAVCEPKRSYCEHHYKASVVVRAAA